MYNSNKKCRVLALEGGGDKGAYQAGAIHKLVNSLPNEDVQWDIISGISVGSLNGITLSLFEKGQEKEAAEKVLELWRSIKDDDQVYENWFWGPIYGFFYKSWLYSTEPLRKILKKLVAGKKIHRKMCVSAVNFQEGTFVDFHVDDLSLDMAVEAFMASAAFLIMFPTIRIGDSTYMDGGVLHGLDIASGINRCLDKGFDESQIIVDTILCNQKKKISKNENFEATTKQVFRRFLEVGAVDNTMREIYNMSIHFPNVNYRYIIRPSQKLPTSSIPLNFVVEDRETMIKMENQDVENVVKAGPSTEYNKLFDILKKDNMKVRNGGKHARTFHGYENQHTHE